MINISDSERILYENEDKHILITNKKADFGFPSYNINDITRIEVYKTTAVFHERENEGCGCFMVTIGGGAILLSIINPSKATMAGVIISFFFFLFGIPMMNAEKTVTIPQKLYIHVSTNSGSMFSPDVFDITEAEANKMITAIRKINPNCAVDFFY